MAAAWRDSESPYALLGLTSSASNADIRAAYQRVALETHPDRPGGDAGRFRRCQAAWEFLKDPELRTAYDAGQAALCRDREHAPALDVDLDDLRAAPCDAGGGSTRSYVHTCSCGSLLAVAEADLREDASCVEFACATCSLRLRVHYASVS